MKEHDEALNMGTERYVAFLLAERQRELLFLERNHHHMQWSDYLSCRRSLQQAINELTNVLQSDPDLASQNYPLGEDRYAQPVSKLG